MLTRIFLCTLVLFAVGCANVPVAEDISQTQATEIVAVLSASGLSAQADKESGARAKFFVTVDKRDYLAAVTILHERGLPAPEEASFSETISNKGFLPNSREIEALRIDRALAAELEELVKSHPGVAGARAVVRSHAVKDQGVGNVSLVVQQKEGVALDQNVLTEMAARAIPGLSREHVFVSVSALPAAQPVTAYKGNEAQKGRVITIPLVPFLYFWKVPQRELASLSLLLLIGVVIIGALGCFLGYWFGVIQQTRASIDESPLEVSAQLRKALDRPKDTGEL